MILLHNTITTTITIKTIKSIFRLLFFGAGVVAVGIGVTGSVVDVTTSGVESRGVVDESPLGTEIGSGISVPDSVDVASVTGSSPARASFLISGCSNPGVSATGVTSVSLGGVVGNNESGSICVFYPVMVMLRLILPRGSLYRQP